MSITHTPPRVRALILRLFPYWLLLGGLCLSGAASVVEQVTAQATCGVSTVNGVVQGQDLGNSCAFLGVPYAAAPVGNNRWRPPQPVTPWTTPVPGSTPPPNCPSINTGKPAGNEDCLKLNIWVSKSSLAGSAAPVIVWLHTGSFVASSANNASHKGQRLAEESGVIVVAPNYRLGPFGFLAHPAFAAEDANHPSSGNYGLMDQRAALVWVRDNIGRFGGDPDNVTLAGTSAGADSVGLHLVSPASAGLFHRAIIESGTPLVRWPRYDETVSQGGALAAALGCTGEAATVRACLRTKTFDLVLLALPQGAQQVTEPSGRTFWLPTIDGIEIPDQPRLLFESGAFHQIPTIVGTTRDEGWNFVTRSFMSGATLADYETWLQTEFGSDAPRVLSKYPADAFPSPTEAIAHVVTDGQFVCETRRLGRLIERTGTRTYLFSYEYLIDALSPGHVVHGVDSNIVFGNDYVPNQFLPHALDADDNVLHAAMQGYWTRFARSGNPNSDDDSVVHWPAFKHPTGAGRGADKYLVFDSAIVERLRQRESACDFFEPYFFRSMLAAVPATAP